jgi:uncharacterized protein (DUF2345 family)
MAAPKRKPAQPVEPKAVDRHVGDMIDVPAPAALVTRPDGQEVHVSGGRYVVEMDGPHTVKAG